MYTTEELQRIQDGIDEMLGGVQDPVRAHAIQEMCQVQSLQGPNALFASLALDDGPLFHRLFREDPKVQQYSFLAFLPALHRLVYEHPIDLTISLNRQATRGLVLQVVHPEMKVFVKTLQSDDEKKIASIAGEKEIGPKQYPSTRRLMTEEWVEGESLTRIQSDTYTDHQLVEFGRLLGTFVTVLHQNNIFYNDLLVDDFAKSHLIVTPGEPRPRLIDFGASVDISVLPHLSDNAVFNYIRTLPAFQFLQTEAEVQHMIEGNREAINQQLPSHFFERDTQFVFQSLWFLASRIGGRASRLIESGFRETYQG